MDIHSATGSNPSREPASPPDWNAAADMVALSDAAREEIERFRRAHETKVLTIFFSDLVGSTELQVEQGNLAAARLVERHYQIMRSVLGGYDGKEISTAGDSMLIVFAAPADAVRFALTAQCAMAVQRGRDPLLPAMRCGIHQGQVVLHREQGQPGFTDVYGVQVSMAARIMSLGLSGQILLSRAVFDDARTMLAHGELPEVGLVAWANHGPYRFKGWQEECDVCEVGQRGAAPLTPPPGNLKGWPVCPAAEAVDRDTVAAKCRRRLIGWWLGIVAVVVTIAVIAVTATATVRWAVAPLRKRPERAAVSPQLAEVTRRLAEIELQLGGLTGVEGELQAMDALDQKYREATKAIFGAAPTQVRSEALQFLARLRTYDLSEEEKALVAKADAQASATFVIYPEEIYNPIRQLAERLVSRQKALRREKESLQAELARLIPAAKP